MRSVWPHTAAACMWVQPMYQRLSQSAGRVALNRKNVHQPDGDAMANGTFTRSHVPAVVQPSRIVESGSRSCTR